MPHESRVEGMQPVEAYDRQGDGAAFVRTASIAWVAPALDAGTTTTSERADPFAPLALPTFEATIPGGPGNDLITGLGGNDLMYGGAGDDTLDGGTGNDAMFGESGNDVYIVDSVGEQVGEREDTEAGGRDEVRSSVSFTLGFGLEDLTLLGNAPINATGNDKNNFLFGNTQANSLFGGAGDDTLRGGRGIDVMFGQDGNDTDVIEDAGDDAAESRDDAEGGVDTVQVLVGGYTLGFGLERMLLLGDADAIGRGNTVDNDIQVSPAALGQYQLYGAAGNDTLKGGNGNDRLYGEAGSDLLDGGAGGSDTLIGGDGSDQYNVYGDDDSIVESNGFASGGIDLVAATVSWTLGNFLENLQLIGSANLNGTGNGLANFVGGNAGANRLAGVDGNDNLVGAGGNDTLDGGTGADTLYGDDGNDTYVVDSVADRIFECGTVSSTIDLVRSPVSWTLGANLERLTLTGTAAINGTGNTLGNVITGNTAANVLRGSAGNDSLVGGGGADRLDGGIGNDTMLGGRGNDVFVVDAAGDVTTESFALAGEIDTVLSSVSRTLGANLERLTLTGTAAIDGNGNPLANLVTGNAAANVLNGGDGNDTLNGAAGNDTLDGGAGNDTLVGGAGHDTLSGGIGLDVFRINAVLSAAGNVDRIAGFVSADDTIQLDDAVFLGIGPPGALAAGAFRIGPAAGDAGDRIVYHRATGQLFFDADGTGAMAPILFATVTPGTLITAADFFVI